MDREALRSQAAVRRNHADAATEPRKTKWTCAFCDHAFASERTFMNHRCRERERLDELRSPIGQAAYSYYTEWMKKKKRSAPDIEVFAESVLYSTFVKFAHHVNRVKMPSPLAFIRLMVESDIQPTLWCRDTAYAMYIQSYDKVIDPPQQFMDSLELAHELAKEHGVQSGEVFQALGVEKLLALVQRKKLSPWFLIASGRFRSFMKSSELHYSQLYDAVQVGPMVTRIKNDPEAAEFLKLFTEVAAKEGL